MLTELSVRDPGLPLTVSLEGEGVDEYGPPLQELDIVSAAVLQGHPEIECGLLDLKRGQGCLLQLAETPFVGVRYEGYQLGFQDPVCTVSNSAVAAHLLMGDQ